MRQFVALLLLRDDGATAVEYSIVAALLIVVVGTGAFVVSRTVQEPADKVAQANSRPLNGDNSARSPTANIPQTQSPKTIMPQPARSSGDSMLPWILVSLTVTIGGVGAYISSHYVFDRLRQLRTRRVVRESLLGRAARNAARPDGTTILEMRGSDTSLIGREGPNLHHWFASRNLDPTAELSEVAGIVEPSATDEVIHASQHPVP